MDIVNLEPTGPVDMGLRMITIFGLMGWNIFESLSLRTPFPSTMVALWEYPIWRFILLLAILLGAEWCPRVGLMTAVAVIFYIVNMIEII